MKTVVLSAGHSKTDKPVIVDGLKESELNMKITKVATDLLRGQGVGVLNVPDDLSLVKTITWINKNCPKADLAVEIHINAGGGTGLEGWYYHNSSVSKKVCNIILEAIISTTGMSSRGCYDEYNNHWGKLGFVHDTKPLACLIECGYIDSKTDRKWLQSDDGLYKIGLGIARGICQYLGVTWNDKKNEDSLKLRVISDFKTLLADTQSNCQKIRDMGKKLIDLLKL